MSVRTAYRRYLHCGKPIPFDPSAEQFGHFCKRDLKAQVVISRATRRKP